MAKRRRNRKTGRFVSGGGGRVRRRRRRRTTVARTTTRRRHRVTASAPRRRRRRRSYASNPPRRRRYRRNPSIVPTARGLVGGIVQGVKDGAAVFAGQVAARKVRGAVTGMLPANAQATVATGVGQIGLAIASAVVTTLAARQFAPSGYRRLIAAGAFTEAINAIVAQTPVAAYLSAFPVRSRVRSGYNVPAGRTAVASGGLRAYPLAGRAGMSAYPTARIGQMYNAG